MGFSIHSTIRVYKDIMDSVQPGKIVLFYQSGNLKTGLVTGIQNSLLWLVDQKGETCSLPVERVVLQSNTVYDTHSPCSSLQAFHKAMEIAPNVLPSALHLLADGEPRDLAAIFAGMGELSDAQSFALFYALKQAEGLISHKKGIYRLMSSAEQSSFAHAQTQARQRQDYLFQAQKLIQAFANGEDAPSLNPGFRHTLCDELQSLQREQEPKDLASLIRRLLHQHGLEKSLILLRTYLGDLSPDADPILAASGLPTALELPYDGWDLDWEHHPGQSAPQIICIDDPQTLDYDDAISIQNRDGAWIIGIHIADISSRIDPASWLFEQLQKRASSLYLPSLTINMLPDQLAQEEFCLIQNTRRPVISLYCELDDKYRITHSHFKRETISISANLSYREMDQKAHSHPYNILFGFGASLRQSRSDALNHDKAMFMYQIQAGVDGIRFKKIDFTSPSRILLEELMVLYNSQVAALARQSGRAFIYRNISSFDPGFLKDEEQGFTGIQAYYSTQALFHPGIGASAYLHGTSPIRRAVDLINQYQLSALLSDSPAVFDEEYLNALIPDIEKRLLLHKEVMRYSERYWLLNYLRQSWMHTPIDAIYIKRLRHGVLFELLPWQKRIIVDTEDQPLQHDVVKLLISELDPQKLYCRAEVLE